MAPLAYKGYTITPRTFQLRGSGQWTLDLLIARNGARRAFSAATTYPTETGAMAGCCEFGRRIIDGAVKDCFVDDLQ